MNKLNRVKRNILLELQEEYNKYQNREIKPLIGQVFQICKDSEVVELGDLRFKLFNDGQSIEIETGIHIKEIILLNGNKIIRNQGRLELERT